MSFLNLRSTRRPMPRMPRKSRTSVQITMVALHGCRFQCTDAALQLWGGMGKEVVANYNYQTRFVRPEMLLNFLPKDSI